MSTHALQAAESISPISSMSRSSTQATTILETVSIMSIVKSSNSSQSREMTIITFADPAPSTTEYLILNLPFETYTETITYSDLNTTLTETFTIVDNPNTQTHYDPLACAYDGYACPIYTTRLDPIQSSLKAANDAACLKSHSYIQTSGFAGAPTDCCGYCDLIFLKVDVFYFPPKGANGSSCINTSVAPSTTGAPLLVERDGTHRLNYRMESLGEGSTVVLNGYTL